MCKSWTIDVNNPGSQHAYEALLSCIRELPELWFPFDRLFEDLIQKFRNFRSVKKRSFHSLVLSSCLTAPHSTKRLEPYPWTSVDNRPTVQPNTYGHCECVRVPLRACTLVIRSKVSLSCRCFPVLLARSIHLPLTHFTVGLRRRSLASTLAMK